MSSQAGWPRATAAAALPIWLAALGCTDRVELPVARAAGDAGGPGLVEVDAAAEPDAPPAPGDANRPDRAAADLGADSACREFLQSVGAQLESPEVIISLDRSFSMTKRFGGSTRLAAARQALLSAAKNNQGAIQFGYQEFPARGDSCDPSGCCASGVLVAPALNNYFSLERQLKCESVSSGCFETWHDSPSGNALARCRDFFSFSGEPGAEQFVLLLTDGEPTCARTGTPCERAVQEVSRLWSSAGVKTMIVALGDETKASACLDTMAAAGQLAKPGSPAYAWAGDEAQLNKQVQDAVSAMATKLCRLTLRSVPPNPNRVSVFLNSVPVPKDPTGQDGWGYNPPGSLSLRLFGSWCDKLRTAQVQARDIRVAMTCTQCGPTSSCR